MAAGLWITYTRRQGSAGPSVSRRHHRPVLDIVPASLLGKHDISAGGRASSSWQDCVDESAPAQWRHKLDRCRHSKVALMVSAVRTSSGGIWNSNPPCGHAENGVEGLTPRATAGHTASTRGVSKEERSAAQLSRSRSLLQMLAHLDHRFACPVALYLAQISRPLGGAGPNFGCSQRRDRRLGASRSWSHLRGAVPASHALFHGE